MKTLRLLAAIAFLPTTAFAAPFTYAPKTCEFEMTFPEKPFIEQKCAGDGAARQCTEVVIFTKVVTPESSVNFRLTCNPQDEKELSRYSVDIMKETIKQMLVQQNLGEEEVQTADAEGIRSAAVVSVGQRGERDILYTGQLWAGKTSLFTLEADMSGPQNEQTDKIFTDILRTMKPKKN